MRQLLASTRSILNISIFTNVSFVIIMYIATLFNGLEYSEDFNEALDLFFAVNGGALKAVLVGNVVYFISQTLDVSVYAKLKEWKPSRNYLWLRNNGSTFISQLLDTVLVTIGFAAVGIFPMAIVMPIIMTTLIIKYLTAIIDTPFIYIMSSMTPRDESDGK